MKKEDIEKLSHEEKIELFKLLVDELPIVITACYGASAIFSSEDIYIATTADNHMMIDVGDVIISTDIMTG